MQHHDTHLISDDHTRLNTLMELSGLINSSLDPVEVRRMAVELIPRCVGADAASLLLLDPATGELYFDVASGEQQEMLKQIRLKPGEGIAGWVARKGGAIIVDEVTDDRRFAAKIDQMTGYQTRTMIVASVATKEKLWGVLEVLNKHDGSFTDDDLEIVQALANQVAIAIENAVIHEEMRQVFLGVTMALADALEQRDSYTGGHTRRVHEYAVSIGCRIGLDAEALDNLRLAAIMRDIGKVGVSDQVLRKPFRLDEQEFQEMCRHPEMGKNIIAHLPALAQVIPGVLYHHEQYDGSGYPYQLKGEQIPLHARIIAVADAFDAMTSDRPYRKALSFEAAFAELKRCAGQQFDPQLVALFETAWQEGELGH